MPQTTNQGGFGCFNLDWCWLNENWYLWKHCSPVCTYNSQVAIFSKIAFFFFFYILACTDSEEIEDRLEDRGKERVEKTANEPQAGI